MVAMYFTRFSITITVLLMLGCQTPNQTSNLYEEIGGKAKLEEIAGNFIREIGYHPKVSAHFEDTNLDRFYEKFIEHTCQLAGGPCRYSGDAMEEVHAGMQITEAEFNIIVDLLINAMDKSAVPHRLQNRLLARLAPLRGSIINR